MDNDYQTLVEIGSEIANATYKMCETYGYENAAKLFRVKAGEFFMNSDDYGAKLFRNLAIEFETKARDLRNTKHKDAMDRRDILMQELNKRDYDKNVQT